MRYAKDHKQRTRAQILKAASAAFRARGVRQVAIAELMKQAELTHGGFYAHFESKDALVAEVCAEGLEESAGRLLAAAERARPGHEVEAIVESYLNPRHRDTPASGCIIPALAGEVARESPAIREAFTHAFQRYVGRLAPRMPGRSTQTRDDQALALVSSMVGALLLARAVDDPALSDNILRACRQVNVTALSPSDGAPDGRVHAAEPAESQT